MTLPGRHWTVAKSIDDLIVPDYEYNEFMGVTHRNPAHCFTIRTFIGDNTYLPRGEISEAERIFIHARVQATVVLESGFMVRYIPTADTMGMYGQFFGFDSPGKFVHFSGKIFDNYGTESFPVIEKTVDGKQTLLVEETEWTDYFFTYFHYLLNFDGYASDETRPICYKNLPIKIMISSEDAQENRKTYRDERKGEPPSISLFKEPESPDISPTKVFIRPESTVDFMDVTFTKTAKGERRAMWLRVRIDGQEGYVQESSDDFPKLGLRGAG